MYLTGVGDDTDVKYMEANCAGKTIPEMPTLSGQ